MYSASQERMSLELAYAMAWVWNRTLVLPVRAGNPALRDKARQLQFTDFF